MARTNESGPSKVYQFISDPVHKENLSGRVRAACITCRRKKTKCSGEEPCATCTEKGLFCEGLTARKKPPRRKHKNQGDSGEDDDSGDVSPWTVSDDRCPPQHPASKASNKALNRVIRRPTESLLKLQTNSNDSGYFSSPLLSQISSRKHSLNNTSAESASLSPQSTDLDSSGVSSTTYSDWSFSLAQQRSNLPPPEANPLPSEVCLHGTSELRGVDRTDFPRNGAIDPSTATTPASPAHVTSDLICTAELLEQQAHSLRQIAMQQRDHEDRRRQTIALPLQYTQETLSSCSQVNQQAAHDDLSLLLGDHSLESMTAESTDWWDINPSELAFYEFPMPAGQSALSSSSSHRWQAPGYQCARDQVFDPPAVPLPAQQMRSTHPRPIATFTEQASRHHSQRSHRGSSQADVWSGYHNP